VPSDCDSTEYYDPQNKSCVPKQVGQPDDDAGPPTDADGDDEADDGDDQSDTGTADPDTNEPEETGPICDGDGDGADGPQCGGNDCDDTDPRRFPDSPERCDQIDNDCDNEVDEINCTFYAHEGETLYQVSPFSKTATEVTQAGEMLPSLRDLDTAPDGTLYGVGSGGYYRFDSATGEWDTLREFPENADWPPASPNGLAIDRNGRMFITSEDTLFEMCPTKGDCNPDADNPDNEWWLEEVGKMGQTNDGKKFEASGDIVINKTTMYMTSKHAETEDHLVTLDRSTGKATDTDGGVALGHKDIFGLTSGWGKLYGLTASGKLLTIDPQSGNTKVIETFDKRWAGAASTPNSRPNTQ
jgi:hypothetical protein